MNKPWRGFSVKLKGRLGPEPHDLKEVRVLNRVVRMADTGLLYEPDPRHVELLIRALGLEVANYRVTPGSKPQYQDVKMPGWKRPSPSSYELMIGECL